MSMLLARPGLVPRHIPGAGTAKVQPIELTPPAPWKPPPSRNRITGSLPDMSNPNESGSDVRE